MDEVSNAIKTIIDADEEAYSICILVRSLDDKYRKFLLDNADAKASLKIIKRLNKGKNESIDLLCDTED